MKALRALSRDEFGDPGCRPCCAVVFNITVHDLPANLIRDRCCNHFRRRPLKVHTTTGLVAGKPMPNMEILLEMVAQGEV